MQLGMSCMREVGSRSHGEANNVVGLDALRWLKVVWSCEVEVRLGTKLYLCAIALIPLAGTR